METQTNFLHLKMQWQELELEETNETTESYVSRSIILHHLLSFIKHDLEALMSAYTNESVLVTQEATYTGSEEIQVFFANLLTHFPKQNSSLELDHIVVKDKLGYIVWHADTPSLEVFLGTDTFIIKDSRIYQQTFCGQMKFKS